MRRIVWSALVVLLVAGCGDSGSTPPDETTSPQSSALETTSETTTAPVLLALADACPEIKAIMDEDLPGNRFPTLAEYRDMAARFAALIPLVEPSVQPMLTELASGANQWVEAWDDTGIGGARLDASQAFDHALGLNNKTCRGLR